MIFKARVIRVAPTLLFWGFFFTPFTSLRFGVVGPGEIMIVVAAIVIFFASHGRIAIDGRLRILSGFWALFLLASLCGLFYNALVLHSSLYPDRWPSGAEQPDFRCVFLHEVIFSLGCNLFGALRFEFRHNLNIWHAPSLLSFFFATGR
jgi:hypothetical protein